MTIEISDVHRNTKLLIDGVPFNVDDVDFVKPGKGRAIYRMRLRNLLSGGVIDRTYHSGEKVEEAHITSQEKQFLYKEGDHYIFMDTQNFEQIFLTEDVLGDKKNFLKEGMLVTMQMMGDKPIDVTLPITVDLAVVKSTVAARADTITAQMKAVELETGYTAQVPVFVKEGDIIKIDTRTGAYVERVTGKK